MADTPTAEELEHVLKLRRALSDIIQDLGRASYGHDHPDLRHAMLKSDSALRGLDDFLKRKG